MRKRIAQCVQNMRENTPVWLQAIFIFIVAYYANQVIPNLSVEVDKVGLSSGNVTYIAEHLNLSNVQLYTAFFWFITLIVLVGIVEWLWGGKDKKQTINREELDEIIEKTVNKTIEKIKDK